MQYELSPKRDVLEPQLSGLIGNGLRVGIDVEFSQAAVSGNTEPASQSQINRGCSRRAKVIQVRLGTYYKGIVRYRLTRKPIGDFV